MSEIINVPKRLMPTASDGKLAGASAIFDDEKGEFQSELNKTSLRGLANVVSITEDTSAEEHPEEGYQIDVIYVNDTEDTLTVVVNNEMYKTPDGNIITMQVPSGGYAEVNFMNVNGTVFVRGV